MTDTNQQTQLPTLQPGDSHMESLIEAAIQGHASTSEAMRWLVRQIVPPQALAQVHGEPVFTSRFGRVVLSGPREDVEFAVRHLPDVDDKTTTPQPAQATQAEVTDAEIVAVMRDGNNCNYNDEAEHIQFARAILALRPERVPMTDEVEKCAVVAWAHFMDTCRKKRISPADWGDWCSANAIRKSNHGSTAQAKKETP